MATGIRMNAVAREAFGQISDIPAISVVQMVVCKLVNEVLPSYYKERAESSYDSSKAIALIELPKEVAPSDVNPSLVTEIATNVIRNKTESLATKTFTFVIAWACLQALAPLSLIGNGLLGTSKIIYALFVGTAAKNDPYSEAYKQAQNILECGIYQVLIGIGDAIVAYHPLVAGGSALYCAFNPKEAATYADQFFGTFVEPIQPGDLNQTTADVAERILGTLQKRANDLQEEAFATPPPRTALKELQETLLPVGLSIEKGSSSKKIEKLNEDLALEVAKLPENNAHELTDTNQPPKDVQEFSESDVEG